MSPNYATKRMKKEMECNFEELITLVVIRVEMR